MLYKIFYTILMGISPWTASLSLSTAVAQAPQVQILERKIAEETKYPQKEEEVKVSIEKLTHSNETVLKQFDAFSSSLKEGLSNGEISEKDAEIVLTAVVFAAEKHKAQTKIDGKNTPYVIHPLEVAYNIMNVGHVYSKDVLIAALLHDVMDDTNTTYEEISEVYGKQVTSYVREMTTKKDLPLKEQKKEQIMKAFHQTPNVAIIKLSDKLSNLGTLAKNPPSSWTRDRIDRYFQWAQSVIENLPEANTALKKEVKKIISTYWSDQEEMKKY
jgi:guanosine-3',5'-bis(diphosphate) 3'-pyrophosphohydrolase